MLPPAYPPRKIDPQQQIRDIENDSVSQLLWDLMPKVANMVHKLNQPFSAPQPEPRQQPVTEC